MKTLKDYRAKRRFGATPEPGPAKKTSSSPETSPSGGHLIFVVHKHAARSLHYDLRLELEGVLKSWAVPKGPSLDPSVKRLAVMVEDHPFEYKDFEGVIPEGNYGAGSVIIWDRGFYQHLAAGERKDSEEHLLEELKKGNMKFILAGEKLKGEFALVRTTMDRNSWLLIKKKDSYAGSDDILKENRSVVSGRTLEEVFSGEEGTGAVKKRDQIRVHEAVEGEDLGDAPLARMPQKTEPMLATMVKKPFDHPDWVFEVKWDGYRAIAEISSSKVSLHSRNLISLEKKFQPVVEALKKLRFEAVLDGEIVVVDREGRPDFQMLQNYGKSGKGNLVYYAFDLLYFQGHDLTGLPLLRRKELLRKILPSDPKIRFSDHVSNDGILFFNAIKEKGLEGIIAKHSASLYHPGRRSGQWLKVKTRLTQEAVIAGFTEPQKGRKYFGSLVLGIYEGKRLINIGHSGGGFNTRDLRELYERLQPLITAKCPFDTEPETNSPATWVRPELVCEIALTGWTDKGIARHPVFLRLRDDKSAREVRREKALDSAGEER